MFGRKNKAKTPPAPSKTPGEACLSFYSANRARLLASAVFDLPLRETVILEKSVEFFQDPAPCYIHRGAVMTRLYGEILQNLPTEGPEQDFFYLIADLPEPLQTCLNWIDLPEPAEQLQIQYR